MDISCSSGTRRCVHMGAPMASADTTARRDMRLGGTQGGGQKVSVTCVA